MQKLDGYMSLMKCVQSAIWGILPTCDHASVRVATELCAMIKPKSTSRNTGRVLPRSAQCTQVPQLLVMGLRTSFTSCSHEHHVQRRYLIPCVLHFHFREPATP